MSWPLRNGHYLGVGVIGPARQNATAASRRQRSAYFRSAPIYETASCGLRRPRPPCGASASSWNATARRSRRSVIASGESGRVRGADDPSGVIFCSAVEEKQARGQADRAQRAAVCVHAWGAAKPAGQCRGRSRRSRREPSVSALHVGLGSRQRFDTAPARLIFSLAHRRIVRGDRFARRKKRKKTLEPCLLNWPRPYKKDKAPICILEALRKLDTGGAVSRRDHGYPLAEKLTRDAYRASPKFWRRLRCLHLNWLQMQAPA